MAARRANMITLRFFIIIIIIIDTKDIFESRPPQGSLSTLFIPNILAPSSTSYFGGSIGLPLFLLPNDFLLIYWSFFLVTLPAHLILANVIYLLVPMSLIEAHSFISSFLSRFHVLDRTSLSVGLLPFQNIEGRIHYLY